MSSFRRSAHNLAERLARQANGLFSILFGNRSGNGCPWLAEQQARRVQGFRYWLSATGRLAFILAFPAYSKDLQEPNSFANQGEGDRIPCAKRREEGTEALGLEL
jgi:hypothetical protein